MQTIINTNEIKTIWRKLSRNKVITAINLFGLTIGIAAVVTISAFVITSYSIHYTKLYDSSTIPIF